MIYGKDPLYLMFHAGFTEQGFVLPPAPGGRTWRCAVDTSRRRPGTCGPLDGKSRFRAGTASP